MIPEILEEKNLGATTEASRGGHSTVLETSAFPEYVFKRYSKPELFETSSRALINFLRDLKLDEVTKLGSRIALPVSEVLSSDGQFMGTLITKVPKNYYVELNSGNTKALNLGYLIFQKRSTQLGINPPNMPARISFLLHLSQTLGMLEALDLVHEDLSARNILWSQEQPSSYILDADSISSPKKNIEPPRVSTIDWIDPRVLSGEVFRPDKFSMSFSMGLIASRVLFDKNGNSLFSENFNYDSNREEKLKHFIDASAGPASERPSIAAWCDLLGSISALHSEIKQSTIVKIAKPALPILRFSGWTYESKQRTVVLLGGISGLSAAIYFLNWWQLTL